MSPISSSIRPLTILVQRLAAFLALLFSLPGGLGLGAEPRTIEVPRGVAQLFVDDELIGSSVGLRRTLHRPKKDDEGRLPVIAPPELQTLMASGTILRDPRLGAYVMLALGFWDPPAGRYDVGLYRFTSPDGMSWRAGDDGRLERIEVDLRDPVTGRKASNIDLCSFHYDASDAAFPYKGWIYFANWGNELEGVWYMRSPDGKRWERVRQVVNAWAGGDDPSYREIRQDGRVLRGPGDVTIFYRDPLEDRFLGIFKFFSVEPVIVESSAPAAAPREEVPPARGAKGAPGNRLRSRAYAFFQHLDEPFDALRIDRIALLPAAAEEGGDRPHDEYYASTAWRYESLWLGGLKIWHAGGDYPYSAAGCAFLKLVSSRDGLRWRKVPFPNDASEPEVFIPNGPEGGGGGRNDGGYMTEFSQGPLRIGDELIFYYGCSSWGKNHPLRKRISGGGIFRARLRPDGFVSVDAGSVTTPLLRFAGDRLTLNAVGPVEVEALDDAGRRLGGAIVTGDSLRHEVRIGGKALREVAPESAVRLRFTIARESGEAGRLYAFRIE